VDAEHTFLLDGVAGACRLGMPTASPRHSNCEIFEDAKLATVTTHLRRVHVPNQQDIE
jgi:hypothetical protein